VANRPPPFHPLSILQSGCLEVDFRCDRVRSGKSCLYPIHIL